MKITEIEKLLTSESFDENIKGIVEANLQIEYLIDLSIEKLRLVSDKLIFTEYLSKYFTNYINKLESLVKGNNSELSFWAAILICHYKVDNLDAQNVLYNELLNSLVPDRIFTTVQLLKKNNDPNLQAHLAERLDKDNINDKDIIVFLKEKLINS